MLQASGLWIYLHTPELWKAGDEPLGSGKLEMIQASSSGDIFISLSFGKLEMLQALISGDIFVLLSFEKLETSL
jgi:hypothetical protein